MRSLQALLLAAAGLALLAAAPAAPPPAPAPAAPAGPQPKAVDVAAAKAKMAVYTDGKGHYLVVQDLDGALKGGSPGSTFFYGDGKAFHAQLCPGSGADGEKVNYFFWDPRWQSHSVDFAPGAATLSCHDRTSVLKAMPADAARKLLEKAAFFSPLWQYRAYALARDNSGNYYYVDRAREPDSFAFRVWSGQRGNMTALKMTNVVSDSEGDIFQTKGGDLRLVLNKAKASWLAAEKESDLLVVPVESNAKLIYSDLGVYAGQRLGTPCDDL